MGQDIPFSNYPGTKKFPCPAVPLSQNKNVFLVLQPFCPGKRAGAKIPRQTPVSQNIPGQNQYLIGEKTKKMFSSGASLGKDRLSKSHHGLSFCKMSKTRAVPFELALLSLCPGTMKGPLSHCPEGQENPVPLETLVATTETQTIKMCIQKDPFVSLVLCSIKLLDEKLENAEESCIP